MIVVVALLVAIAGILLIGVGFGRSVERARSQEAMATLQAVHDAALEDLRGQVAAMTSVSRFVVGARDEEIQRLKAELELERRAHVRDLQQPAGWGAPEGPSA